MKQGKVITIWSPSSGTGSTFTAINLCKRLNKDSKAIVVDLDVRIPSLGLYLDIDNKEDNNIDTIFTFVKGNNLTKETLENNIIKTKDMYWIKGTSSPDTFYTIKKEEILKLIEELKEIFDYVILDTHAAIYNLATYVSLESADKVFVVLERNVILVKQYKLMENILKTNNFKTSNFQLILNKSNKTIYIDNDDILQFTNLTQYYELPRIEDKLINAINQGEFLDFLNNRSLKKYSEELENIILNIKNL